MMFWAGVFVGFWTGVAWNHWVTLQYQPKPLNGYAKRTSAYGVRWRKDGGP